MSGKLDREFLRHTVATLAYRAAKVLRDVEPGFADFRPNESTRSPGEILAHLGDLFDWASSIAAGSETWSNATVVSWQEGADRFFAALSRFDEVLASDTPIPVPLERLFQGPIADALTHVGQIALLRRMAGVPIRGENYFVADVERGRVTSEQAPSKAEFG